MKANVKKAISVAAIGAISLLSAESALAAHPLSVTGNWSAVANQSLGNLAIVQAASAATCKPIAGNIFGSPIQGYYCPVTGRIVFARLANGVPFQFYEAHVSRTGLVLRMGGSVAVWNASGGGFANEGVDYNFSAAK
jgi:hypothetical protein